jgi:2-methylcitrate dehydratase PrpD
MARPDGPAPGEPALATLADFAAALKVEDLAGDIRRRVKTCVVDVVWGCLQVHDDPRAKAALRATMLDEPGMQSAVLTTSHRASPADAAFVSAAACAATDRSDTHLATATHPGIVVVPALLAALDHAGGNGSDLMRGVVVGYEVMGRMARAVMSPELAAIFRPTAVAAPVAAAIAVASALRFDREAIIAAGALAAQTSFGLNEWARAGTGEHVFHAGVAARNAVTCALLARQGGRAARSALDGPSGLLAAYGVQERSAELTRELGERFEIRDIVFKPAPACFFAQTPVQVAQDVAKHLRNVGCIECVEIRVSAAAAAYPGCAAATGITTGQLAVMSIPFGVAATLCSGRLEPAAWSDFANPSIIDLASRCTVVADDALSCAYPGRSGARLRIRMTDGSEVAAEREDFQSMDDEAVVDRFRTDAALRIGRPATEAVLTAIERLEELDDVRAVGRGCAADVRSDIARGQASR